ncbi:MAG: GAF domain-containing protein [Chloroflexota bacterium]|nr:GAF domain-containing protein [Chloroflexota bacterium]
MRDDQLRCSLEDLFSELSATAPESEAETAFPPSPLTEGTTLLQAERPDRWPPTQHGWTEEREKQGIYEAPQSIIAARVTNIRARLIGSLLIVLALLLLTVVLYSVSFSRLDEAVAVLEEMVRASTLTGEQRIAVLVDVEAALRAMQVVPMVWGLIIAATAIVATLIIVRSIAHPVERLTKAATHLSAGHLEERIHIEWVDEFGRLGIAFNEMAARLQASYAELERRVAERTRDLQKANEALQRRAIQLEASAEVGRAITSIFDVDQLLRRTVDLIRDRFGFYHAGVFLIDETGEWAVLREATGDVGQQMKAQGHRLAVGDHSMVGWTAAHHQPRIALDVGEDAVHFANPLLSHTRSEMTQPLVVGDRLLGVLDTQSTEESAFDDNDIRALRIMADQIAVAIDNARNLSDEALLLEATSPIYRTSRRLAQATTTEEVTGTIIDSVSETGADGCVVVSFELSPAGELEALLYLGVWRRDREPHFRAGMRLSVSESPFPSEMVSTLWTVADVEQDERLPWGARQVFEATDARALANIPLHTRERVFGQVVVLRATPGPFSETALRLYEALSDQASVALERARLLEEAQRRAERERLVNEITTRVRRPLDVDAILRTAVQELGTALGASEGLIRLGNDDQVSAENEQPWTMG